MHSKFIHFRRNFGTLSNQILHSRQALKVVIFHNLLNLILNRLDDFLDRIGLVLLIPSKIGSNCEDCRIIRGCSNVLAFPSFFLTDSRALCMLQFKSKILSSFSSTLRSEMMYLIPWTHFHYRKIASYWWTIYLFPSVIVRSALPSTMLAVAVKYFSSPPLMFHDLDSVNS